MTGRHQLDELHALAAEISDHAHGWRKHRRERVLASHTRRHERALLAHTKRRKRHRVLAGIVVAVVAIGLLGWGLHVRQQGHRHTPTLPSIADTVPGYQLPDVRAGRQAAAAIAAQGRATDPFTCEDWFDSHGFNSDPTTAAAGWHAVFMKFCLNSPAQIGSDG